MHERLERNGATRGLLGSHEHSDRRHTRLISEYGGLKKVAPRLVAAFLIVTLSSIGLPGLNGFVGEFLILLGTFRVDRVRAVVAATGVGAGDLVATLIAGSKFGYTLMWAAVIGCIVKVALAEATGRWHLATGRRARRSSCRRPC